MNAKQLKDSILEYVIKGKLNTFSSADEDITVFLENLNLKKQELINSKVLKKDKEILPLPEELPHEIPKGWSWVRLGEVFEVTSSKRVKQSSWENSGIPFYRAREIVSMRKNESLKDPIFISEQLYEENIKISGYPKIGDILLTGVGTLGIPFRVKTEEKFYFKDGNVVWLKNHFSLNARFIEMLFDTPLLKNHISANAQGTTVGTLTIVKTKNLLLPLPPLAEQERILLKLDELYNKIELYNVLYSNVIELNEKFPINLEKSVLHYAMQGKLVEQNPNDETAQQLIEKIQLEKKRLIQENIIKKEKPLPPIIEELSVDIPSSWSWVRLGYIISLISGRDLTPSEYGTNNSDIPYITGASNFNNGEIDINRWTPCPKVISKKGDILITCKGTVGELAVQNIEEAHIARQVMAVRLVDSLDTEYIKLSLKYKVTELKHAAKSMIPGISRNDLLNLIIPLPPLNEQKRIVRKVNILQEVISKLKK